MSHPIQQIKKLLKAGSPQTSGKVVAVMRDNIHVATRDGVSIIPRTDATAYRPGDEVILKNGTLQGRRQSEEDIPIYSV